MANDLAAVVMAGGLGTRMKSATPKHLHPLLGRRMVDWVVQAAKDAGVERVVVVASPDTADCVRRRRGRRAGDAARHRAMPFAARRMRSPAFDGDVLVLNGDVPALTADSVRALVETHRSEGAAATVLAFEPEDTRSYGRIVRDANGRLARIVEAADARLRSSRSARSTPASTSFAPTSSGPRSSGSSRTTRRASST